MCTHEVWTYSECGCRYDHHITCFDALADREEALPEPRLSKSADKHPSTRTQVNSSRIKRPPSPSPTDSEDEEQIQQWRRSPQRSCSVNRTIHKAFLEPICHDCLMAELIAEQQGDDIEHGRALDNQIYPEKSLIWGSDVKIEVGDASVPIPAHTGSYTEVNDSKIMESNVEVRISDSSHRRSLIFPSSSRPSHADPEPSTFSTGDADSESSVPSATSRGRQRSRSKQLRRRAMEVSREDLRLRISSRLPSFQRKNLQSFKDDLQRGRAEVPEATQEGTEVSPSKRTTQPLKSFMQRLTDAHGQKWLKAKDAVNDIGRKMNRKSPSPKRHIRLRNPLQIGNRSLARKMSLHNLKEEIGEYNRAVDASTHTNPERPATGESIAPESFYLQPNRPFRPVIQPSDDYTTELQTILPQTPVETWRMHLEQDLTTPRQRKHRPVLCSPLNDDASMLLDGRAQPLLDVPERTHPSGSTSTTAVLVSTGSGNWQSHASIGSNPFSHKSYEYPANHDEDTEFKRRLLSVSTLPSVPGTATSESLSIESPDMQGRRMASLVSDGDFDQPDDQEPSVGTQSIEREMAMVGLTENPWCQAILSCAGSQADYQAVNACSTTISADREACDEPSTPPRLACAEVDSPPTAIRSSATQSNGSPAQLEVQPIQADLSSLSGLPNTITLRARATQSEEPSPPFTPLSLYSPLTPLTETTNQHPSPSPSPTTPSCGLPSTHRQLALHALSTPFHHSLAPNSNPRSPHPQPLPTQLPPNDQDGIAQGNEDDLHPCHFGGPAASNSNDDTTTKSLTGISTLPTTSSLIYSASLGADEKRARPRSIPAPIPIPAPTNKGTGWRTITHKNPGDKTPEAPDGFSLGMKSPGVAGLFGCVWVRELCPGVAAIPSMPVGADVQKDAGDGDAEGEAEAQRDVGAGDLPGRAAAQDALGKQGGKVQQCGRVTGWRVRSCLCSGRVRTSSSLTVAVGAVEGRSGAEDVHGAGGGGGGGLDTIQEDGPTGEGGEMLYLSGRAARSDMEGEDGDVESKSMTEQSAVGADKRAEGVVAMARLDAECRSVAPVVRYVVGEGLCALCRWGC